MEPSYQPGLPGTSDSLPVHATALLRSARAVVDGLAPEGDAWRRGVPLTVLRRGERNTVFRARIPAGADAPTTLVLKMAGGDAELADADLRHMVALSGLGVVPDVVADLADARGFAMIDAGDDTLARSLEVGTAFEVRQGVLRMARAYARLHVEGRALVARTEAMRSASLTRELGTWTDGLPRALAWLQLSDADPRVRRALTRIVSAWYADRAALTLTHGDPAPTNVLFLPETGEARLIDFEYGAARHPAHDLTAWDVLCPLPEDLVQSFRREYDDARRTLGWPVDEEDGGYAAMLASRALALLSWLPPSATERDGAWVDDWTARQAVLSTLDRLALRCAADGALHGLAEVAHASARHWRRQWPEVGDVLPPWPALRVVRA